MNIEEKDIHMVAEALLEMFGDDAIDRVSGRIEDYRAQNNAEGEKFWFDVSNAISKMVLKRQSND